MVPPSQWLRRDSVDGFRRSISQYGGTTERF